MFTVHRRVLQLETIMLMIYFLLPQEVYVLAPWRLIFEYFIVRDPMDEVVFVPLVYCEDVTH